MDKSKLVLLGQAEGGAFVRGHEPSLLRPAV